MERKPYTRSLQMAQKPFYIGIDLGGTNIKVGVVDSAGKTFYRHSVPTDHVLGPDEGSRRMGDAVLAAMKTLELRPKRDVAYVGLGSPGTMDIPRGMLVQPVNLPTWKHYPLRDRVAGRCGLPVAFENDANAAAYGEKWVGGGKRYHSMALLTLGTGVGCGVIIGDSILDGEHSHGAECGHIIVNSADDAAPCNCGQRGCLEAYASATALINRVKRAICAGRSGSLAARVKNGEKIDGLSIAQAAEAGDPLALDAVMEAARWLGIGIVSLMHTIDPNIVLLGGAMTFGGEKHPLGKQFLARVCQEVQRRAFPTLAKNVKIKVARLGGDAGYIGAAGIARLEHLGLRAKGLPSPVRKGGSRG